jgi:hypothetical protein
MWWVSAPPGGDAAKVGSLPDDRAASWWRILAGRTGPRVPVRHTGQPHPTAHHMARQVRDRRYGQMLPQVLHRSGELSEQARAMIGWTFHSLLHCWKPDTRGEQCCFSF